MSTPTPDFKERARELMFNSHLKDFPVVFELYVRAYFLNVDLDESMATIISIIRTSKDSSTAFELVNHHLDTMEEQ